MEENILKLIGEYKRREEFITVVITELEKENRPEKSIDLALAKNTRVLWRVVIKDLEKLIR